MLNGRFGRWMADGRPVQPTGLSSTASRHSRE
jgi:hypothetical protein